jgi:Ca-activated chloride channel family protein
MGRIRPETVRFARWIVLIFAFLLLPDAIPQDTVIRVNVQLVRLLVTVKNGAGDLVGTLGKSNFAIYDNGAKQDVAIFEHHTDQPLSIALLFDTSASVGIALKYESESAIRFLHAVLREGNPDDEVAFYTFNWQVSLQSDYTRRAEQLERKLHGIHAEGGTSLYDAIYLASQEMQSREGRHVLIIVTDGGDTTSYKDFHQALEGAQRADAVIYPILVMPITNDAGRNIGGENALTTLSRGTGGLVFKPDLGAALDNAFNDILSALRTQYLLGYYPKDVPLTKNRFHQLRVTVDRPALQIITRTGYYGDSEDTPHKR